MKLLILILLITSPAWACYSMKSNPTMHGLKDQLLCRPIQEKTYDYSFGQRLSLEASGLRAQMKLVNTHFGRLQLEGGTLSGDFRDLSGKGVMKEVVFKNADFRYADMRDFSFADVQFENARFEGTNFKGADLRGVEFLDCNLEGAIIDRKTKLPFSIEEAFEKGMVVK